MFEILLLLFYYSLCFSSLFRNSSFIFESWFVWWMCSVLFASVVHMFRISFPSPSISTCSSVYMCLCIYLLAIYKGHLHHAFLFRLENILERSCAYTYFYKGNIIGMRSEPKSQLDCNCFIQVSGRVHYIHIYIYPILFPKKII